MREPEPLYRYFLKFSFEGREEPIVYEVDKATTERVSINLEGARGFFCWFSTVKGQDVAVNLGFIDFVHFLFEPGTGTSTGHQDETNEDDYGVVIHFRNRNEPLICGTASPAEVSSLFDNLQLGGYKDDPFLWFTDEDDELVIFDGRKVLCIEAPSEMVKEGQKDIEKEKSELSESMVSMEGPLSRRTPKSPIPFRRRKPREE